MSSLLENLYRLQTRILFVQARQKERDTLPPNLVEVDREYQEKLEALKNLTARLSEAEAERRRAEGELADLSERLKKYQAQLRNVQSSREYSAMLNEIDGVEKLVRAREDRILALEEEIENARQDLTAREGNLPRETEQHEEKLKDWRAAQHTINEELQAAEEEIRRLEEEIAPRERLEFRRLLEKKRGVAVVPVVSSSCSACHVKIRPALLQALKAGREITYCDNCKRILYPDQESS